MPSNSKLFVKPFIGGINTELSSVEDAILYTADELNCTILPEGIRGRRLGFNIERDGQWVEGDAVKASTIYYWDNVGKKNFDYIVVQRDTMLHFFISSEKQSSRQKTEETIDLTRYKVSDDITPLKFSSVSGDIIVAGSWLNPIKISWDYDNSVFEVKQVNIKWRDLLGIDDGLRIDQMPSELTPEHKYNLYNQGWDKRVYDKDNNSAHAVDKFHEEVKLYPSNNMLHFLDKRGDTNSDYDAFEIMKHFYGDTPAPKGHYILDYFTRSRTVASGIELEESLTLSEKTVFTWAKDDYWRKRFGSNYTVIEMKETGSGGFKASDCLENPNNPYKKIPMSFSGALTSVAFEIRDFSYLNGSNTVLSNDEAHRTFEYMKDVPWYTGPLKVTLIGVDENGIEETLYEEVYNAPQQAYIGDVFAKDIFPLRENVTFDKYYLKLEMLGVDENTWIKLAADWNILITAVTASSALPSNDVIEGRIQDIECFNGRYFYLIGDTVLFSQVLKDDGTGFDKCYQEADPTSEEISDVVDTDGGYVKFPTMGRGLAIKTFNRGVLVFGDSSVYGLISPMEQIFTATNYDIVELSRAGLIGSASVVTTSDSVYYWSPLGIFRIGISAETGNTLVAQSVSISTIQEAYNNIPLYSKKNCKGVYDYVNNRIYWYYPTDENNLHKMTGCLVFDLTYKSFMMFKIGDAVEEMPHIVTAYNTPNAFEIAPTIYVRVNGERVVSNNNPVLAAEEKSEFKRWTAIKHLIDDGNGSFSFGDYNSREFKDFDKVIYDSYMVSRPIMFTGYSAYGNPINDTSTDKQVPILQTLFKRTEQVKLANGKDYLAASGAQIRVRWGWSLDSRSNRWDMVQNGYRPQKDFLHDEYVESRIHVRGRGKAFQVEIRNDDNKDFRLAGMNILVRSR